MTSDVAILGGGIAGLSLASFLDRPAVVLEREESLGGLARSYHLNGVPYDIGPHIIFSKNQEILDLHTSIIDTNRIRRSNRIFFKGRFVKYPFENDLSALDPPDRDYCLHEFLSNPYEGYEPTNMLQVFLSLFGEGITKLYLQPYNEKIWKFDPAFMNTEMVGRLPKPPREDVIQSANGVPTEGYTHQLHFHYPKAGGFQTLVNAYRDRAVAKGQRVETGVQIREVRPTSGGWTIRTDGGTIEATELVNCMPIHELMTVVDADDHVKRCVGRLRYNSICVVAVQVARDTLGDNFAVYVPEREILFHRVSKLDFLGESYRCAGGGATLLAEVTYRPDSHLASYNDERMATEVIDGLDSLGFINRIDVTDVATRREQYAYVVYDLDHKKNIATALGCLSRQGIRSVGRFATFEYLNSDGVVEQSLAAARELNRLAAQGSPRRGCR